MENTPNLVSPWIPIKKNDEITEENVTDRDLLKIAKEYNPPVTDMPSCIWLFIVCIAGIIFAVNWIL